ncbi:MAG: hypothetical protein AVDCRST_MAG13-852 [uncultured Solirubrobacteraceae bacterium]|uniref:Uncharacterized protein n=1 Tax=uncultured Solirubrobacteraceae bacterium TaxID=1162706 RepID=A0A6J4RVK0_9ACTN|nr:MAG: hypothetical protein AVDCRST_MAG13-852 [uncultured Solirubrobacteraceae bacterium]
MERLAAEDLRRLHRPQARAVQRADDDVARALLDRVRDGRRGDRRVALLPLEHVEALLDELARDERAGGVLDHHDLPGRGGVQRGQHRV